MNYHFAPDILLRMPVRKTGDHTDGIQSFLNDPLFRAAIRVATPAFFNALVRQEFLANKLSEKETLTLRKYINRYCFRPTPFGLFSSVSLIKWSDTDQVDHPFAKFRAYFRAAMPVQHILGDYLLQHQLKQQARFEGNPSIYRVLNEYRFFRTGLDGTGLQREYQLQSIAFSRLLKDLLKFVVTGCSREDIVMQIAKSAACTTDEARDYTDFLIDAQLLIPVDRMSITGADYLARLADQIDEGPEKNKLLTLLGRQENDQNLISTGLIDQLEEDLHLLLPESELTQDKFNVILKRESVAPDLELRYQDKLRDSIDALELITTAGRPATMTQFVNSFQQYFEGQTLPLLRALDPEAGIGYQQPEPEKNNPLLETLHIPYRSEPTPSASWSSIHSVLLERWLNDPSGDTVIKITEPDLKRLKSHKEAEPILGMSVLFRIAENKVFIENAGGNNAPALMGRFTVADEEIHKAAKDMARGLEAQNPDILFAELLHLADPHTDNINRRAQIYQYEIPITAASALPGARQIRLSDLYVSIINNKAMLFSAQHQKFVIPRLTSAYNHSLNKLPLFRFLADLSYQYARSNLALNLRQLFPGLHFYPRVEYKESILCLAEWVLTEIQIKEIRNAHDVGESFTRLSKMLKLTRYFSLAEGDQELVFDSHNKSDIAFFANCIRQKKEVLLKEFLDQPVVRQYKACLLPDEPLHFPNQVPVNRSETKLKRKFVPGSSWLYLKVYAPKTGADRLLLRLAPLLHKRYGGHKITEWFFIRYKDHAPHIRLRLQVNPDAINEILMAFKTKLEDRIEQHVIREFQIDVYSRELERYAAGGIENTEGLFWASSELVLHFLKQQNTKANGSTHLFALYSTFSMMSAFITDPNEQLNFTLLSFQLFLPEFSDRSFKVDLDKKYRELSPGIVEAFKHADPSLYSGSVQAGIRFQQRLQAVQRQTGVQTDTEYLRSIIHMHLNRIFTDESRKQEMICYYFLHKYLVSQSGRNKRKATDKVTGPF